jgi:hypothetical protein
MKTLLFYILSFFTVFAGGNYSCKIKTVNSSSDQLTSSAKTTDTIIFSRQIQPILVKNCSPCHFPGGKMYEKMPFDKDTTLINHSTGILRRIKNEEENTMLKNFVAQNKKSLPESKLHK